MTTSERLNAWQLRIDQPSYDAHLRMQVRLNHLFAFSAGRLLSVFLRGACPTSASPLALQTLVFYASADPTELPQLLWRCTCPEGSVHVTLN